jgi:hypothetical protein
MPEDSTAQNNWATALVHILLGGKTPEWLRALVLIAVLSIGISVAGAFIIAVISGRSVQFWPPEIGQYESPSVQQCKIIIDFAKASEQANDRQIGRLQAIIDNQVADLAQRRDTLLKESAANTSGQFPAKDNKEEAEKDLQDTTQKILTTLKQNNDAFLSAQKKCAG